MSLQVVLEGLREHARREILQDFRRDSCVASTRTVIRVLRHFGYNAVPFPVQTFIYNRGFVQAIKRGDHPPVDTAAFKDWCARNRAWSVGVGVQDGETSRGFAGHLVALLRDQSIMVDASADQADRPQYNIYMPPTIIADVRDEFMDRGEVLEYEYDGMIVAYNPILMPRPLSGVPDWAEKDRTKRAVKAIIRKIEGEHVV